MIKLKELYDTYIEYSIPKIGIGAFQYDLDINQLKNDIDGLGYKGRFSIDDMISNEDYVLVKANKGIRLYSNNIKRDDVVRQILKKYKMEPTR